MLTAILALSLLGQCSNGSCAMPSAGYSYAPQFSYAPAYQPAVAVTPPQLYRLADSTGAFFTHTNPAYLQSWIAARNTALATALPAPPKAPPPAATLCPCAAATGSCPCLSKAAKATVKPVTPDSAFASGFERVRSVDLFLDDPDPPEPR